MKRICLLVLFSFALNNLFCQSEETVEHVLVAETIVSDLPENDSQIPNENIEINDAQLVQDEINPVSEIIEDNEIQKVDSVVEDKNEKEVNGTEEVKEMEEASVQEVENTDANDDEFQQKISEYLQIIIENEELLGKDSEHELLIAGIEGKKADILELRSTIAEKTSVYSKKIDSELAAKQNDILNAPVSLAESNGAGGLSESASNRRKNKCIELERIAEKNKADYEKKVQEEIGKDEKLELSELSSLYKTLESKIHHISSYSAGVSVEIKDFNVDEGCWTLNFKCRMFNIDNILETSVQIPYSEVTGKKYIGIEKLTEEEFDEFKNSLEFYSEIFSNIPQVFYSKLNFQVYRWKLASEYRMVPKSLEVTFLGRKNAKIIKITENLTSRVFQLNPVLEVRNKAEISNDAVKATKIIAAEAKERETEEDRLYKEYSNSYENSKKSNVKEPVIQKGRGAFLITAEKFVTGEEIKNIVKNFDSKLLFPESVNFQFDFPIGPFNFFGISAGVDVPVIDIMNNTATIQDLRIEAGLNFGFNVNISNHLRPYIIGSGKIDTKYNGMLEAGAGLDLILGKGFMINLGYDYCWRYDFNNILNPNIDKSGMTEAEKNSIPSCSGHNFSLGLGFAW